MRTFDYSTLKNCMLDAEILGYIAKIHEYKGRQELFVRQKKDKLETLVEIAKIQSTESSNKIEGIVSTNTRIKQLVQDKTTPRNRDEKEIMGYRDVLNIIHENYEYIPITPNYILQLHKHLYQYANPDFGGKFKNTQNYIVANLPNGESRTLFTPLSPVETPVAVQELCETFNRAMDIGEIEPLLLIINFIKDFLCIHPFNDGNGRMSRLLTTLLLYRSGFVVCKYISLEKKIENTKDNYYDALEQSSENWLEGKNDNAPFVKYMLGILLSAYRDFEERLNLIDDKRSSKEIVEKAVSGKLGKFTKSDIQEECPSLARQTIEKALKQLCDSGKIEKKGSGSKTYYIRKTI